MHEKKTRICQFAKTLLDPITFNITLRYVSFVIRISSAKKINTAFLTFTVHGKANVFFCFLQKNKNWREIYLSAGDCRNVHWDYNASFLSDLSSVYATLPLLLRSNASPHEDKSKIKGL